MVGDSPRERASGFNVYVRRLLRELFSVGGWLVNALSLAVGLSGLAVLGFVADRPALGTLVLLLALLVISQGASWRLWKRQADELAARTAELAAAANREPSLRFGRPKLDRYPQNLAVGGVVAEFLHGRVVQVPICNEQGAGEARNVHAVLYFNGKDNTNTLFYPLPAQGEWETSSGQRPVEIEIPPNGRPTMLNILAVLTGEYPNAYEWTTASRDAWLRGYEIKSNRIDIEIEVRAASSGGTAPTIGRVLTVDFHDGHLLHANWKDSGERTNWVPLDPRV